MAACESDCSTAWENTIYSEYSEPPSEADVTFDTTSGESLTDASLDGSSLPSMLTCATSLSQYSTMASEADVELYQSCIENSFDEASATLVTADDFSQLSVYSMPESEACVEMDTANMLYPQSYITFLKADERQDCDTPAPPLNFGP